MTSTLPRSRSTQIPVNPTDPIVMVNGQVITRQQLADECVARKGKEIPELMINRTLVEQALRAKKLEVTAAEIDQEIETVAKRFGIGRERWLRTLDKERGHQPDPVRPGHHLPGARAAEAVRGPGAGDARTT